MSIVIPPLFYDSLSVGIYEHFQIIYFFPDDISLVGGFDENAVFHHVENFNLALNVGIFIDHILYRCERLVGAQIHSF